MANTRHPQAGRPFSRPTLDSLIGSRRDKGLLSAFNVPQSQTTFFDDFLVDTINLDNYAVANGGGTGVGSFALSVAEDGTIRGTTGTSGDATASANIIGPAIWYGDRSVLLLARFKISAITEVRAEIGLIDVVPSTNASAINSLTTPSVNASVVDTALYLFNDASATTTSGFFTKGSSLTGAKTVGTGYALTAATYADVAIELDPQNGASFWFNGVYAGRHADAVEGGNALAFWARVSASNGTSKTMDIDYILATKDRSL